MSVSKVQKKRNVIIDQIVKNQGSEANSYAPIKSLLCDPNCGIGLNTKHVLVDSALSGGSRPDLSIWLDVPDSIRNENEYLYAVIEAKTGDFVKQNGSKISHEKIPLYRRSRLHHFWLLDAQVIERYDFSGGLNTNIPTPQRWDWADLTQEVAFDACFHPLMNGRPTLAETLSNFASSSVPDMQPVGAEQRKEFIDSVVTVARIISRTVTELVNTHLIPDLQKAIGLIAVLEARYGKPSYDWSSPDEYLIFPNEPTDTNEIHVFNQAYTQLIEDVEPYVYALKAETKQLKHHAERSGLKLEEVSFLKNNDSAHAGTEAFIQETASLLLSRLLMIRFSEDHGLLTRYLSNGGLSAFARYAAHFKKPYQTLVREAYDNAKPIYHHLFERKALDWIIERDDQKLSMELLHAMWILARWDFTTVRGDILSGVYDKYLEPTQRKRLGEIYTRPELARYMLEACGWDRDKTILDPTCGTGTFLVEAFDMALRAAEESGLGFDIDDAVDILKKIHGLDINEFSATLAKIQLLWHVLSSAAKGQEQRIKEAIRLLHIEGGHSSLDTWGLPMENEGSGSQGGLSFSLANRRKALKASDRRFRNLSTLNNYFDVVVGNPPYIRTHRVTMSDDTAEAFEKVVHKQTDLSAFFVYRTLRWWLKPGGKMAFFLPLALTEAAYAEKLRKVIDEYRILEIVDLELLGNVAFHGTNIVTFILVVEKVPASDDDEVLVTTVNESCYDFVTGIVNMENVTSAKLKRKDISLTNYLPVVANDDESDDDENDNATDTGFLTKLKPCDISILTQLANKPRLNELIEVGYKTRKKPQLRTIIVPGREQAHLWEKRLIRGKGLEIGGKAPQDINGKPILKGGDVFPDGVDGAPFGYWSGNIDTITTPRFYLWTGVLDLKKSYVFRRIALAPTVAPHPADAYLQDTAYIVQLKTHFPLNIYNLSRIMLWFTAKTGRTSVVQKYYSTWYPRNMLRIPIPNEIRAEFIDKLQKIGEKLIQLDNELASSSSLLDGFLDCTNGLSEPLRHKQELLANGKVILPNSEDWPANNTSWQDVVAVDDGTAVEFQLPISGGLGSNLSARTESGKPCRIGVADPRLRRWITWAANIMLSEGKLPSQSWVRNLPIPSKIDDVINLLDRIENNQAQKDFETKLYELDIIVSAEMGLSLSDRDYIIYEVQNDPLLSKLQPAWRHTAGRRKGYKAYGENRTY